LFEASTLFIFSWFLPPLEIIPLEVGFKDRNCFRGLLGIPEVPAEEQSGLSQDPQVCQQHSTEHAHEEHNQLKHYLITL
jgi:hypothetical protein